MSNSLKPRDIYVFHMIYHEVNLHFIKQCIYLLCMHIRTISDYFSIRKWFVFIITKTKLVYCAVRAEYLNESQVNLNVQQAVRWLRRLVAGLSLRKTGFDRRYFHVWFVVDEVPPRLFFSCGHFGFHLSVSFHQWSALIYMMLSTEWQMGEAWKPPEK
jgi:hypothetical protein